MLGLDDYEKYLKSHNIDFEFLNKEYNLMRIPFDRPNVLFKDSLECFVLKCYELNKNIELALQEKDNERFALMARKHFDTVLGKDWKIKLKSTTDFIDRYNNRFKNVMNKILEERVVFEQERVQRENQDIQLETSA